MTVEVKTDLEVWEAKLVSRAALFAQTQPTHVAAAAYALAELQVRQRGGPPHEAMLQLASAIKADKVLCDPVSANDIALLSHPLAADLLRYLTQSLVRLPGAIDEAQTKGASTTAFRKALAVSFQVAGKQSGVEMSAGKVVAMQLAFIAAIQDELGEDVVRGARACSSKKLKAAKKVALEAAYRVRHRQRPDDKVNADDLRPVQTALGVVFDEIVEGIRVLG